jgi:RNA polymerase sigma-70 factor (ECF subfamily)
VAWDPLESSSETTDDTLVGRACLDDADAFSLLYRRYRLDAWNMARFLLRNHHEAEDAVQETFVRAHRALRQYQRHSNTFRPWLLAICRNVCFDRIRLSKRRPVVSLSDLTVEEHASDVTDHDLRIDFQRALDSLPAKEQEAFFVVDVMGFRSEEAAEILGLSAASTLRSRLARARKLLAPLFADPPQPANPRVKERLA